VLGATAIATGHTLDDQAETVLLRLLRGAGSRGLAGIRVRRGRFIRPLLGTRRLELREWLDGAGHPYREDSSNADRSIPRNRLRHDVLPVLEQFAPRAVPALARAAALAEDDDIFLEAAAIEAAARLVLSSVSDVQCLDSAGLAALPPALSRRVLRSIGASMHAPAWSARHLSDLARLAGRDRGRLDLPGVSAVRRGRALELRPRAARQPVAGAFDYELPVPGSVEVPEAGAVIEAVAGRIDGLASEGSRNAAVVSKSCMEPPLRVRSRRPGDRFRPLGAPGSRKLQDVLVDRKVPRELRDRVPIVVSAGGEILWVAGVAVAEACRVTDPESGMVTLKLNPLVGER
jgi:tRNA(Ile)-lysidine synthase